MWAVITSSLYRIENDGEKIGFLKHYNERYGITF